MLSFDIADPGPVGAKWSTRIVCREVDVAGMASLILFMDYPSRR